jgi:hypothetical protein
MKMKEIEISEKKAWAAEMKQLNYKLQIMEIKLRLWRKTLKVVAHTSFGLLIELKPPLAKIQTYYSEKWFSIDELNPQGN